MKKLALASIATFIVITQIACSATSNPKPEAAFAPSQTAGTLAVTISGIEDQVGNVLVAIYDSSDSFRKEPFKNLVIPADSEIVSFTLDELAAGEYAVMVFHDIDGNAVLKTNVMGLPREPWGASLRGSRLIGPPKWKHVKFAHMDAGNSFNIQLR